MRPAELHTTGGFAAEITRLSPRLCHATRDDISIAGSPPTGEDDEIGGFYFLWGVDGGGEGGGINISFGEDGGLGGFCKNDEIRGRRKYKQSSFSPLLLIISAFGGN